MDFLYHRFTNDRTIRILDNYFDGLVLARPDGLIFEILAFVGGKSVASTNGKVKFKVTLSFQAAIFYFAYLKNKLILSSI